MKKSTLEIFPGFNGYLVESDKSGSPSLILIHEIFGITPYIRELAESYASAGYNVLVPDLFWRVEPGIELDPAIAEQRDRAMQLNKTFNDTQGLSDLIAAANLLRVRFSRKIGAIGYCLGGRLSFRLAASKEVDAGVSFYGVNIHKHLEEAQSTAPLLIHVAGADYLCPPEAQQEIYNSLNKQPDVEVIVYEGAGHAFARPNSQHYAADAAQSSSISTSKFLVRALAN